MKVENAQAREGVDTFHLEREDMRCNSSSCSSCIVVVVCVLVYNDDLPYTTQHTTYGMTHDHTTYDI